ncbi:hypothetical protein ONS95_006225 [Cadophora gregata]|uniref:uncharacterized protein n=1 Tax=Cadophora gregata TaxID=51156 RepID=UPI0026DB2B89|nr:uncharacterized protein ONS95_006225 [Cadophora gregata]KAK0102617.1 hypothetical protein ONS95_006225 [Cadophora gregata]
MATSQCPSLPNELWTQILENLRADEDLPTLWKSCRNVSTIFRDAAESIFREQHLPKTNIYFFLGEFLADNSDEEDHEERLEIRHLVADFNFSSLSEDRATATFTVDTDELPENLHPRVRKRLREYVNNMNIEVPRHTVQIRRDVNDGPIPGWTMDYDKLELSCDWRELFGAFYSEEYLYHKFTAKALTDRALWLTELKSKVDRGELDPMKVMTQALTAFADDSKDCRKLARRVRIGWQFKKHDGTEWDFGRDGDEAEEKRCLAELQKFRHFSSLEEFSDDDSEEGDEEEDDKSDDNEEDEWEDTDTDGDN